MLSYPCHCHCPHCCCCCSSALLAATLSGSSTHHPCCRDSMHSHPCQLGCQESAPGGPTSTPSCRPMCCVSTHIPPPPLACPITHPFSSFLAPSEMPPSPLLTLCHCALSTFCVWLGSPYHIFVRGALLPHVWLHSPSHFCIFLLGCLM